MACKLDGHRDGYGIRDGGASTDAVKMYARMAGGKVESLQVYAAQCPVEVKAPVQDLGVVSADDSARWLIARAKQDDHDAVTDQPLRDGAFSALAMHRGDLARDSLADVARRDARRDARKSAVFWLALMRGTEGADITSSVMFADKDPDVRQHAAFSMSQSKSPRAAPDLIKLAKTDTSAGVRGQAWFWLAQTGAEEAEREIGAALRSDGDDHVREQAVFALSMLPGERAPKALIAAAEDQSLTREQRKRAIFWLAQSQSSAAQGYLDKIIARIPAD
jgi:HEAT repeat protein